MKKPKFGKTGRTSPKKGVVEKPKMLEGKLKQTEGYTPRSAMPGPKVPIGGKKARDKRLSNVPM